MTLLACAFFLLGLLFAAIGYQRRARHQLRQLEQHELVQDARLDRQQTSIKRLRQDLEGLNGHSDSLEERTETQIIPRDIDDDSA